MTHVSKQSGITYFPSFDAQITIINNKTYIYDIIRKKYVRLTPEEWTRQHLLHYLTATLQYPTSRICIERKIQGHNRPNRTDILVYDRIGVPFLLAECKATHVPITQEAYYQVARYNSSLKVNLLVITNGIKCFC